MTDPHNLERFIDAQNNLPFEKALAELRNGKKEGHWIWFIFPQMVGLGSSEQARHFGISSMSEAKVYLDHPVLGQRLLEVTETLLTHQDKSAIEMVGEIDAMKIRSSLTLFLRASENPIFRRALESFFENDECQPTISILSESKY
jgi:uncharacterized protein (DUF1810 family)